MDNIFFMSNGTTPSLCYSLPFNSGTRILSLASLEYQFKRRPRHIPLSSIRWELVSFKKGIMVISAKIADEPITRVYLKVEQYVLLVKGDKHTAADYASHVTYQVLRAMLYEGTYDFDKYYWPECFESVTGAPRYIRIFRNRYGLQVRLKKPFKGFYKLGDPLPELSERKVFSRASTQDTNRIANSKVDIKTIRYDNDNDNNNNNNNNSDSTSLIGYCLASTDPAWFHSRHYPFLIPYRFTPNGDQKTVKSFQRFLFEEDVFIYPGAPILSFDQWELNRICYKMIRLAPIYDLHTDDDEFMNNYISDLNLRNKASMLALFHKALPKLAAAPFGQYFFTFGMKNIYKKPLKKICSKRTSPRIFQHLYSG